MLLVASNLLCTVLLHGLVNNGRERQRTEVAFQRTCLLAKLKAACTSTLANECS